MYKWELKPDYYTPGCPTSKVREGDEWLKIDDEWWLSFTTTLIFGDETALCSGRCTSVMLGDYRKEWCDMLNNGKSHIDILKICADAGDVEAIELYEEQLITELAGLEE